MNRSDHDSRVQGICISGKEFVAVYQEKKFLPKMTISLGPLMILNNKDL